MMDLLLIKEIKSLNQELRDNQQLIAISHIVLNNKKKFQKREMKKLQEKRLEIEK